MKKLLLIFVMTMAFAGLQSQVIENFESIKMNIFSGGTNGAISVVPNPDTAGNPSCYVGKMVRGFDGDPWAGWYAILDTPIDVTANKYVHVKLWKPRISPIKFKIEGGAAGTIEIPSMYPQTKVNEWEDIVFDFSEKTGTYPIIAFLPDFMDPVGLTEDITIYFDDIVLSNDPTPVTGYSQTINVDMTESGMTAGEPVWIAGALGGIYGTWAEPGTNANNQMLDGDGDGIYSITLALPEELYAFKFFWGMGWGNGDLAAGGDRVLVFSNPMEATYKWGVDGLVPTSPQITFICNMQYQIAQGNFIEGTDYMDIAGSFNGWNGENHHLTSLGDGKYGITVGEIFTAGETIEFKFRINGNWNTSEFPNGGPNRTYTVLDGFNEFSVWYNDDSLVQTQSSVVFTLNMSHQIKQGNFVVGTDFVDITGSLPVENPQLTALGDSLYGITIDGFTVGDVITYKYRINGTTPETISDRTYTVVEGENVLDTVWFNNEVAGINDPVQEMYNIYPNPMMDKIVIGNMKDVNKIEIYNVSGQLVKSIEFTDAIEQTQISTEDLNSGMYIMTIYAGNSTSTTKLLKY